MAVGEREEDNGYDENEGGRDKHGTDETAVQERYCLRLCLFRNIR